MADSKTFVVTGASSGIGKAVAKLLVSHGNAVIGLDIKEPDFELKAFHRCDLSKVESIDQTLAKLPTGATIHNRTERNWLVLQSQTEFIVIRLDDSAERVLAAFEALGTKIVRTTPAK